MNERYEVKLALTGGTGFIARGVLTICIQAGLSCRALSRSTRPSWAGQAIEWKTVPSYGAVEALGEALSGARYLLHLADNPVRAHEPSEEETLRNGAALIEAARAYGVKGLIVASSVYARVGTDDNLGSYGAVKRAMEDQFLAAPGLSTIILRLPPVYGPGGRGGLAALSQLVRKKIPLPLGAALAPRAYLSRHNLASLIIAMVNAGEGTWKGASGRIFEPSDGTAVSTRDLIDHMASQIGVSPRSVPFPIGILRIAAAVVGKSELVSGAIDPLDVAPVEELETAFGWRPVECMPQSLAFLRDELSSS